MRLLSAIALIIAGITRSWCAVDLNWDNDEDLTSFVTRPELKSPRFDVTLYEPDNITPGYWFVAPYFEIAQRLVPEGHYEPCQIGPHIYDSEGELIYSGACMVRNQNACDFRAWHFNDTYFLSAILFHNTNDVRGRGVIMDASYQIIREVIPLSTDAPINMHEFNLVDEGKTALHIIGRSEYVSMAELNTTQDMGHILNIGMRAIDVNSGQIEFEWWAHPHVSLSESSAPIATLNGGWNWFHGNSVDRNADGDYLLSARFTDTVYKISGSTGEILWRLGGVKSDFELRGFNFSRQHDARWVSSECTSGKEVLTLLDNAGDGYINRVNTSSALKLELDHSTMVASVIQQWVRPDESRSNLRGNFQHLPNGNFLAAWSDNAYASEHSPDGRLLMEAEFASRRQVTYRAYRMDFVGQPKEDPVLKAFVYGIDAESSTTVSYVSWNGATEVDRWSFYNEAGAFLGDTRRQGFETRHFSQGFESAVYAEAVAKNGSIIGRSNTFEVELPEEWSSNGSIAALMDDRETRTDFSPKTEL